MPRGLIGILTKIVHKWPWKWWASRMILQQSRPKLRNSEMYPDCVSSFTLLAYFLFFLFSVFSHLESYIVSVTLQCSICLLSLVWGPLPHILGVIFFVIFYGSLFTGNSSLRVSLRLNSSFNCKNVSGFATLITLSATRIFILLMVAAAKNTNKVKQDHQ